jgi:hypothetical protein
MDNPVDSRCVAFFNDRIIASGTRQHVVAETRRQLTECPPGVVLFFDEETSLPLDLDLREPSDGELHCRLSPSVETDTEPTVPTKDVRGPGRPKLGVVAREVTLLPRHWQWLNSQPGGASVALRKLVEAARKDADGKDRLRLAQESTYRFMSATCGNRANFEDAARALFARDIGRFRELSESWPVDLREHLYKLASRCE